MSLKRRSVAFLVPGTLVCIGVVGASRISSADANASVDIQASSPTGALPRGVFRTANGRYTHAMCSDPGKRRCLGRWLLPESWQPGMDIPKVPEAAGSPMAPADIINAYKIPAGSAANGKIVAIIDEPDKGAFADLTGYRAHYKLPVLPKCANNVPDGKTPCFAQVAEDGGPSTGTDPSPDADGETALDMDMISAACPDCSILLVEFNPTLCESDFTAAVATAAKMGASAISISFGGPETTDPNIALIDAGNVDSGPPACPGEVAWDHDQPGPFSQPGHLVFIASGDFGYDNINLELAPKIGSKSPSWPSSSPFVIAVGGTTLFSNGKGGGYGEAVWNDGTFTLGQNGQDITTSGCSTEFAMPPWQTTILTGSGCTHRATADLSAAAAFTSGGQSAGIAVYQGGQLGGAEGTSAASPMVAAIFTRLGLTTEASNDLSWVTKNAAAFNDVGSTGYPIPTGGSKTDAPKNANCGILCNAGTGWDGPTGVGTPNGTKLAALPISDAGAQPYPDAGVPIQLPYNDAGAGATDSGSTDTDSGSDDGTDAGTDNGTDSGSGSGGSGGGGGLGGGGGSNGTDGGTDDADGGGDGDTGGTGNSGGCNSTSTDASSLAGVGLFGLAFAFIAGRRRDGKASGSKAAKK